MVGSEVSWLLHVQLMHITGFFQLHMVFWRLSLKRDGVGFSKKNPDDAPVQPAGADDALVQPAGADDAQVEPHSETNEAATQASTVADEVQRYYYSSLIYLCAFTCKYLLYCY